MTGVDKRMKENLKIKSGLSKYRVGLDDYKRMEGLMVGEHGNLSY